MSTAARVFALAFACMASTAAAGAAASPCSSDTFTIDGTALAVEVCAPGAPPAGTKVTLIERFTVKGQVPLERVLIVEVLPKAGTSRSIDDVPLAKLGIDRTLHITVVYPSTSSGQALSAEQALGSGQAPRAGLEHALLVPGAIALK